jgi:DNA-binding NarL/FixJ family response regulator
MAEERVGSGREYARPLQDVTGIQSFFFVPLVTAQAPRRINRTNFKSFRVMSQSCDSTAEPLIFSVSRVKGQNPKLGIQDGGRNGVSVLVEPAAVVKSVPQARIRIVLVEDHAILREGLKALIEIESDIEVVGDFGGVDEVLAAIRELKPALVLTDLALPGRSGFELLAELGMICPTARKLILTAHNSEEYIRAALNAGADGYVLKDANRAELTLAIRTVAAGQQFLCKAIASKILLGYLAGSAPRHQHSAPRTITGREREVLTRIALGESNKVIARSLDLSVKTIEKHRSNLMRKLQLHNVAAITMFAVRNGLAGVAAPFRPELLEIPEKMLTFIS